MLYLICEGSFDTENGHEPSLSNDIAIASSGRTEIYYLTSNFRIAGKPTATESLTGERRSTEWFDHDAFVDDLKEVQGLVRHQIGFRRNCLAA